MEQQGRLLQGWARNLDTEEQVRCGGQSKGAGLTTTNKVSVGGLPGQPELSRYTCPDLSHL